MIRGDKSSNEHIRGTTRVAPANTKRQRRDDGIYTEKKCTFSLRRKVRRTDVRPKRQMGGKMERSVPMRH